MYYTKQVGIIWAIFNKHGNRLFIERTQSEADAAVRALNEEYVRFAIGFDC